MSQRASRSERFIAWCKSFWPPLTAVDRFERMRSAAGALFGITLTGAITHAFLGDAAIWLVAPMGASAVLLFAAPAGPMAQPWAMFGGNMVSAIVGVLCAKLFAAPVVAAGLAVALAIGAMFLLRCLHPPGGAMALTMVVGGPAIHAAGFSFVLLPVALNTFLLVLLAVFYNNAVGRRYPNVPLTQASASPSKSPEPSNSLGQSSPRFTAADLDAVLKSYNQVIDISRDELAALFLQTEMQAYRRRFGESVCAEIMQTSVMTVEFATELEVAWRLLQKDQIKALVVLDRGRRVIGIVTPADFLRHAGLGSYASVKEKLREFIRRTGQTHSQKPEVIGQIMTSPVKTARTNLPIVELLPLVTEHGLRHIPVVDEEGRLAGLLTQAGMVAALYGKKLLA